MDVRAGADDDAVLDELFGQFVEAISDGRDIDPATALPGRPDLLDRVRRLHDLASRAVLRRPPEVPAVPGFDVERLLGAGGMGKVWLARDRRLGRRVALKVLPARAASAKARERFAREARAVARLEHPLLVPIHGMGEDGGHLWFSMQYVEGRTLAQILAAARAAGTRPEALGGADFARFAGAAGDPPEPWRDDWVRAVVRSALDAADALAHAHAQGVVHRDVKPSNVIVRPDGFALVFDFGLADVEDETTLTLTRGFLGTPHYASPEQAAGDAASLDARTDVWSLGATLHELLTLEPPFSGPTTHEVLRRIQAWDPEPPSRANPAVPAALDAVVRHALRKERDERYPGAAAFADDLRAFLAGRPVSAPKEGLLAKGLRLVQRNRALTELLVEQRTRNAELRDALRRAEDAQRAAESERDKASAVTRLLVTTLGAANPAADGRDVRVADVLGRAADRARSELADAPDVAVQVLTAVAGTFTSLGLYDRAIETARDALARTSDGGAAASAIHDVLAQALACHGDLAAAETHACEALRLARCTSSTPPSGVLALRSTIAQIRTDLGRAAEAEADLRAAIPEAEAALGPDHEVTLFVLHNHAIALGATGQVTASAAEMRRVFEARSRTLGPRHPETIDTQVTCGQLMKEAGDPAAGDVLADAVAASLATFGERHRTTHAARHNHAGWLESVGRLDEAAAAQRALVTAAEATQHAEALPILWFRLQLARIELARGNAADAAANARIAARGLAAAGHPAARAAAELADRATSAR